MTSSNRGEIVYLDSKVYILPAIYSGRIPENAKEILVDMVSGEFAGVTSSLTIDEVVWRVFRKTGNRGRAIDMANGYSASPTSR